MRFLYFARALISWASATCLQMADLGEDGTLCEVSALSPQ